MGKVFESVRQAVDRLATKGRQTWLKLSVRERALVVGCAVVALLVAPVLAADWAQGAGDRVIAARSALDDRRAIHPASGSARALDEVMAEVEAWSYVSDTAPLARIGLQNQLATTAEAAGLTDVRLVIDDDLILDRGIPLVRAEVSAGRFRRGGSTGHAGPARWDRGWAQSAPTRTSCLELFVYY